MCVKHTKPPGKHIIYISFASFWESDKKIWNLGDPSIGNPTDFILFGQLHQISSSQYCAGPPEWSRSLSQAREDCFRVVVYNGCVGQLGAAGIRPYHQGEGQAQYEKTLGQRVVLHSFEVWGGGTFGVTNRKLPK